MLDEQAVAELLLPRCFHPPPRLAKPTTPMRRDGWFRPELSTNPPEAFAPASACESLSTYGWPTESHARPAPCHCFAVPSFSSRQCSRHPQRKARNRYSARMKAACVASTTRNGPLPPRLPFAYVAPCCESLFSPIQAARSSRVLRLWSCSFTSACKSASCTNARPPGTRQAAIQSDTCVNSYVAAQPALSPAGFSFPSALRDCGP
jgi:hypothetical protein